MTSTLSTTLIEARTVRLTVGPAEANAIVHAVAFEASRIGETLMQMPSDAPGDLLRIREQCERLQALADVAEQLQWRQHHRDGDDPPLKVKASIATLLDLASVLDGHALDVERYASDNPYPIDDESAFARARTALAEAIATHGEG